MIDRRIAPKLRSLAQKFPAITLTGPRQSGKTTLVRSVFPDYEYVSLEDSDMLARAQDDPVGFFDRYPSRVIFDEAQRFPGLFSYAQGRIDERGEAGQYILTGSQNLQLLNTVSQSLAGRVAELTLLPFSYAELADTDWTPASAEEWVVTGAYPRVYDAGIDPADYYPSYVQTYLERDVRRELGVVKLAEFERFLALCALRTGELLNVAALARDCGVTERTVRDWLSVLESSYIVHLVQPYSANRGRRLIKTPKLYFWDTGLACSLMGIEGVDELQDHTKRGALFETAVVAEAMKHGFARGRRPKLSFWRDTNGNEVDLVVEKDVQPVWAFKIKSSRTYNSRYFDQLEKVASTELGLGRDRYAVVYGGNEDIQTQRGRMIGLGGVARELEEAGV